ncbi:MAG: hypothetical protein M1497_05970 [Nitrospirae bacterium]|nr:hypothetical protein [Nitrospirota bacterium]
MIDYRTIDSLCIVFLHGIGDFVMLMPALRKMKRLNPSLRLGVVLRKELGLRGIAENSGFIDEVHEISLAVHPKIYVPWIFWTYEYWKIRHKLKAALKNARKFEKVKIVYAQLMPTIVYLVFCPGRVRRHKIDVLASELDIALDEKERNNTFFDVPGGVLEEVRGRLRDCGIKEGRRLVGIQRNTLDRTRFILMAEVQRFIDDLDSKGLDIYFIVFADGDSYRLEEAVDGGHLSAGNLKYSWEIIGSGDALFLSALVKLCDYVVSVDSAVFNIAGALGRNTIGVFNTYKVRSDERALKRDNIVCIDKRNVTAEDLLERFDRLFPRMK